MCFPREGPVEKNLMWDFPGGPVVRAPCFQCRWCGFDPRSGSQDPACYAVWPKKRKEKASSRVVIGFLGY